MTGTPDVGHWLLAVAPIALLVALVLWNRLSTSVNALATAATALVIGATAFHAGPTVLGVGLGKGLWTGFWILYVIWPALLVYHLARPMGLMRLGDVLSSVLPRRVENVLIVAWVFPSLVQGVAGFGTPIAVSAPLLVSMGIAPVTAVALPLIGYHWSVGFGSMGSSFYMGALTAGLHGPAVHHYAAAASLLLGVNAVLSGGLVCLMHSGLRGLREGGRMVLVVGPTMALTQALTVRVEPAIGALAAGTMGFAAVAVLRLVVRRGRRGSVARVPVTSPALAVAGGGGGPVGGGTGDSAVAVPAPRPRGGDGGEPASARRALLVLLPYQVLLAGVLAVFVPSASRAWVKSHLLLTPSFPSTRTAAGVVNKAVHGYTPIELLGHPGSYLLMSGAIALLVWNLRGHWPRGALRPALTAWRRQAAKSSPSVLALAALATVMVDTGMVRTIALGAADVAGKAFPAIASSIGLLGAFTTGSTTSSNALFSPLQSQVATLIGVPPADLLASQLSGGNVGNSIAPMVILIGATAIGIRERVGEVFRRVLLPAAVLNASVVLLTLGLVYL